MALRSPTADHAYWGTFATASALPNVSGSPTQSTNLQAGDDAYVTAAGVRYVCTTATPGGAAWTAISPYTGGSPTRNPIDANHTHVWYMGQGCTTTGLDILPTVGGVTLSRVSGTGTIKTGFACFKTQQSLMASQSAVGISNFTGPISIGTTQSFSLEGILLLQATAVSSLANYQNWLNVDSTTTSPEGMFFRYHVSNNTAQVASSRRPGPTVYGLDFYFGGGSNQIAFGVPHHYMLTWDVPTTTLTAYFDGKIVGPVGNSYAAGPRSAVINQISIEPLALGVSIADVRISNIVRPQSYAIAATQAMLAL